jgi:hypothetical protein
MASNSLSYVDKVSYRSIKALLIKAIGSLSYIKMALVPTTEAAVSTKNCLSKLDSASIGGLDIACLS